MCSFAVTVLDDRPPSLNLVDEGLKVENYEILWNEEKFWKEFVVCRVGKWLKPGTCQPPGTDYEYRT